MSIDINWALPYFKKALDRDCIFSAKKRLSESSWSAFLIGYADLEPIIRKQWILLDTKELVEHFQEITGKFVSDIDESICQVENPREWRALGRLIGVTALCCADLIPKKGSEIQGKLQSMLLIGFERIAERLQHHLRLRYLSKMLVHFCAIGLKRAPELRVFYHTMMQDFNHLQPM